jgi:hypothetical protein
VLLLRLPVLLLLRLLLLARRGGVVVLLVIVVRLALQLRVMFPGGKAKAP